MSDRMESVRSRTETRLGGGASSLADGEGNVQRYRWGLWAFVACLTVFVAGATLAVPARAQDPFAQPTATGTAAVTGGATATPAQPAPGPTSIDLPGIKCDHVTSALCAKQNTPLIATAAGYVVVCVLLVALLRAWWNKRGSPGPAFAFWFPMFLGATGAGLLAGLDPVRGDDLKCCLASGVFRAEVILQDSSMGRAFLFGAIPAVVLYLVVALVIGLIKR
jgi:hypothetical protein